MEGGCCYGSKISAQRSSRWPARHGLEVGRVVGRLCNSPGKLSLGHVLRWWLCKVMAGLGRGEFEGQ